MSITRIIAHVRSEKPGDTLVCIGGIHGNEWAGIHALERVAQGLESRGIGRGEFVALAGNLGALKASRRFLDADLNRHWGRPRIETPGHEETERGALMECLTGVFGRARGHVTLIDLHTVSGPGQPFAVFADTLISRSFARRFHCPIILGLEEHLDATLVDWVGRQGHTAVAFEGGQHLDPRSADALEDIVWHALGHVGLLDKPPRPQRVIDATRDLPTVCELVYRHEIASGNGFLMRPGFSSFDIVHAGQSIADDPQGSVEVPMNGRLLMPLYQNQGDDGFFVIRTVSPTWLPLSAALRRARAGRLAHWLPGVRRDDDDPDLLIVDQHVARWFALQVLHLLGFKRDRTDGSMLYVRRRSHELP